MDDTQRQHKPGAPRPATAPFAPETSADEPAALGPRLQAHIGHQLRSMYDDVLNQPVPDRFMDLLRRLDSPAEPTAAKGAK